MRVTDVRTGREHNLIFDAEVLAALRVVDEQFACSHPSAELRVTRASNGSEHYRPQCLTCGARMGNAVKKPDVELAPEDAALRTEWNGRYEAARSAVIQRSLERQLSRDSAFWKQYSAYLSSPEWAHRRSLVLKRANGVCEGCGTASATQVHHLSYANVTHEFLFELVAVCHDCHERLHADDPDPDEDGAEDVDF